MLNIVPFGVAFLEKNTVEVFPYISLCRSLSHSDGAIYDPRDFISTFESPCPRDAPW